MDPKPQQSASCQPPIPAAEALVSPLVLRRGEPADIDELIRITDDGRAALGGLGIDQWQGGTPTRKTLENDLASGNTWFAADARTGDLLGCAALCMGGEPDYDNLTQGTWLTDSTNTRSAGGPEPTYSCVHRVAVAEGARRRGVAGFLFDECVRMSAELGLASVRVDTHAGNLPMQALLKKHGFTRCCTLLISLVEEPTKERIGYERVL